MNSQVQGRAFLFLSHGRCSVDIVELTSTVRADTSDFNSKMSQVKGAAQNAAGAIGGITTAGMTAATALGNLAADAARALGGMAASVVSKSIGATASMQQMQVGLETLIAREMARGTTVTQTTYVQGQANNALSAFNGLTEKQWGKYQALLDTQRKVNHSIETYEHNLSKIGPKTKDAAWKQQDLNFSLNEAKIKLGNLDLEIAKYTDQMTTGKAATGGMVAVTKQYVTGQMSIAEALPKATGEAKAMMDQLAQLAILSPYQVDTVTNVNRMAMAFGYSYKESLDFTKGILNMAAGVGASNEMLDRMAYNFAQIRMEGRVTKADVRQLAMAGFDLNDVLRYVGKQYGLTIKDHNDFNAALDAGKIKWEDFTKIFAKYADENFGGASERMSRTLGGLSSTLHDTFLLTMPKILTPAAEKVTEFANRVLDDFLRIRTSGLLEAWGKNLGDSVGGALERIGAAYDKTKEFFFGTALNPPPVGGPLTPAFPVPQVAGPPSLTGAQQVQAVIEGRVHIDWAAVGMDFATNAAGLIDQLNTAFADPTNQERLRTGALALGNGILDFFGGVESNPKLLSSATQFVTTLGKTLGDTSAALVKGADIFLKRLGWLPGEVSKEDLESGVGVFADKLATVIGNSETIVAKLDKAFSRAFLKSFLKGTDINPDDLLNFNEKVNQAAADTHKFLSNKDPLFPPPKTIKPAIIIEPRPVIKQPNVVGASGVQSYGDIINTILVGLGLPPMGIPQVIDVPMQVVPQVEIPPVPDVVAKQWAEDTRLKLLQAGQGAWQGPIQGPTQTPISVPISVPFQFTLATVDTTGVQPGYPDLMTSINDQISRAMQGGMGGALTKLTVDTTFKDDYSALAGSMTEGVAKGITDSFSIENALKASLKTAVDAGKVAIEAKSPSKLTAREIGAPIVSGIAVQVAADMPQVGLALSGITGHILAAKGPAIAAAMDLGGAIVRALIDAMNAGVGGIGGGGGGGGKGTGGGGGGGKPITSGRTLQPVNNGQTIVLPAINIDGKAVTGAIMVHLPAAIQEDSARDW